MKYEIEMQVRYVPLPAERRSRWLLAMQEIWTRAKELSDGIADSNGDDDNEFDFGC
jgi:hypothetical protein